MKIRAVLFDLGDTLMHADNPDWSDILTEGDRALALRLAELGLPITPEHFHEEFRDRLEAYYHERDVHMQETSTFLVLEELLKEKGIADPPESIIRAGLDALYAVTQRNWILEDDARECLSTLQAAGYKMGIVSNAGDNKDVFQLVDKFNIEPFFDFVLTSAACGVRKPHPQIFQVALAPWGIPAEQVAMVGDKLEADVIGANQSGIYSIWIRRRANPAKETSPRPRATVDRLDEIPGLLTHLE